MGPKSAVLVGVLDETTELLRSVGAHPWADRLDGCAVYIREADFRGITGLHGSYGGMGSINDLYICPSNGHTVSAADAPAVNRRLEELLGRCYEQAQELYRDQLSDRE